MSISEAYIEIPSGDMGNVFGQMDANTKKIERTFQVSVIEREGRIKVVGAEAAVQKATSVLKQLQILSERGNIINEHMKFAGKSGNGESVGRDIPKRAQCSKNL